MDKACSLSMSWLGPWKEASRASPLLIHLALSAGFHLDLWVKSHAGEIPEFHAGFRHHLGNESWFLVVLGLAEPICLVPFSLVSNLFFIPKKWAATSICQFYPPCFTETLTITTIWQFNIAMENNLINNHLWSMFQMYCMLNHQLPEGNSATRVTLPTHLRRIAAILLRLQFACVPERPGDLELRWLLFSWTTTLGHELVSFWSTTSGDWNVNWNSWSIKFDQQK